MTCRAHFQPTLIYAHWDGCILQGRQGGKEEEKKQKKEQHSLKKHSNKGSKAEMSLLERSVAGPLFLVADKWFPIVLHEILNQMPHTIWLWKQSVLGIIPGKRQTLHYVLWSATPS